MQRTKATIRSYKHAIIPSLALLRKHPRKITHNDLLTLTQHLTARNDKPQTINQRITQLKQICKFYGNEEPFTTWQRLTEEEPTRRCPTKEQTEIILQYAKKHREPYMYPFMMTLGFTGLRITALCNLTLDEIDFDNRLIRTTTLGKRKKKAKAPVNAQYLLPVLMKHIKNNNITYGPLWTTSKGTPVRPHHIRNFLTSIADKAGYWSPHDFRRGIATLLYRQSRFNLRFVQTFLGHESIEITAKYIGIDDMELREHYDSIINKLDFNV